MKFVTRDEDIGKFCLGCGITIEKGDEIHLEQRIYRWHDRCFNWVHDKGNAGINACSKLHNERLTASKCAHCGENPLPHRDAYNCTSGEHKTLDNATEPTPYTGNRNIRIMTDCGLCNKDLGKDMHDGHWHDVCGQVHDARKASGMCTRCGKDPIHENVNPYWCQKCGSGVEDSAIIMP